MERTDLRRIYSKSGNELVFWGVIEEFDNGITFFYKEDGRFITLYPLRTEKANLGEYEDNLFNSDTELKAIRNMLSDKEYKEFEDRIERMGFKRDEYLKCCYELNKFKGDEKSLFNVQRWNKEDMGFKVYIQASPWYDVLNTVITDKEFCYNLLRNLRETDIKVEGNFPDFYSMDIENKDVYNKTAKGFNRKTVYDDDTVVSLFVEFKGGMDKVREKTHIMEERAKIATKKMEIFKSRYTSEIVYENAQEENER